MSSRTLPEVGVPLRRHAWSTKQPFTWQIRGAGASVVAEGIEWPAVDDGSGATRCPECNQTVRYVDDVIQSHNRIRGGKGERCPGSGRAV